MTPITCNTWVISDTHFFDRSFNLDFLRPAGWQDMVLTNWNRLVKPDEPVLHLGDLSLGSGDELRGLIPGLPDRMTLLRGNHNKFSKEFYEALGIEIVEKPLEVLLKFEGGAQWLVFSHEPQPEALPGRLNIHGHTHGIAGLYSGKPGYFDASIEATHFQPMRLGEIISEKNGNEA